MAADPKTDDVELRLLRLSAVRCLLYCALFLVLQVPMWLAPGHENADRTASADLRLSLLLDIAFSIALLMAAFRLTEFLRANEERRTTAAVRRAGEDAAAADAARDGRDRRFRRIRLGGSLLAVAALLNLAEAAVLWGRFAPDGDPLDGFRSAWVWYLTPVIVGLTVAGGVLVASVLRRAGVPLGDPMHRAALRAQAIPPKIGQGRDTVIACSGGGIRSASFCLGALQALMAAGVYRGASAVVGVSGGGYMAAAFHYVGRHLTPADPAPFEQGTPELTLMRRQTRYLLPHKTELFRGLLSILWGVLVNVVMIAFALRALSWVLGWYLDRYDVVITDGTNVVVNVPFLWAFVALAPWGFAVLLFLILEKGIDRFAQVTDDVRRGSRAILRLALSAGTVTTVLMLGVPYTLHLLNQLAGSERTLPKAITVVVEPGLWGYATAISVITALLALAKTLLTGLNRVGSQSRLVGKVLSKLRLVVAPWLGTAIILVVAFVVFVRWTSGYATRADWRDAWTTGLMFLLAAVVVRVFTDANRTSLHHFYRERLATAYLVQREDHTADVEPYTKPLRVSKYAGRNGGGGPELVMAAVANVADQQYVPSGRGCVPFIISASATGVIGDPSLPPRGTKPTRAYEDSADYDGRDLTVPAAMAISGAAFSPLTGRANARTRPVRVLLTVLNARLGVWLPNPYLTPPELITRARAARAEYKTYRKADADGPKALEEYVATRTADGLTPVPSLWKLRGWELLARTISVAGKPGPYRLLREAFGQPSLYDRKLYVTDGGHYDNLGLLEALRRRPDRIVVIDASADDENSFGTLAEAIATARMDLGVEITFDTSKMRSTVDADGGTHRAEEAWAVGHALYSNGDRCVIYLLKALLTDGLSTDVEHYKLKNPEFPRRSTGDQLYDEWDFEAYRYLGNTLAYKMLDETGLGPMPRSVDRSVMRLSV
ncbi:hypothetical protein [Nocardioides speluncae]|uniref:hypothetical protein n=1 Tax=Nocardioides speluncae TaxID=2670337 RepID=UPI000D68BDC8|nr:hypothetical protein [Nocardioides speluncae]